MGAGFACLRAALDALWHGPRLRLTPLRGSSRGSGLRRARRSLREDVASAARHLRRNRGFTVTAVGILALGIGLNTAVFGVVYSLLLRPLPGVTDPDRLVQVYRTLELSTEFLPSSIPLVRDMAVENPVFSGVTAWSFVTLGAGRGEG